MVRYILQYGQNSRTACHPSPRVKVLEKRKSGGKCVNSSFKGSMSYSNRFCFVLFFCLFVCFLLL